MVGLSNCRHPRAAGDRSRRVAQLELLGTRWGVAGERFLIRAETLAQWTIGAIPSDARGSSFT